MSTVGKVEIVEISAPNGNVAVAIAIDFIDGETLIVDRDRDEVPAHIIEKARALVAEVIQWQQQK